MGNSWEQSRGQRLKSYLKSIWKNERLIICILLAVILGLVIGITINSSIQNLEEPTKTTTLVLLGFPGELLMRMLKMLIQPLIVCSLIVGLASLGQQASGRIGKRTVIYYLSTTVIAMFIGLILVLIIQPGKKASIGNTKVADVKQAKPLDSFLDFMRNLFPENIVQAAFLQQRTVHKSVKVPLRRINVNLTAMNYTQVHEIKQRYKLITETINAGSIINRTYYIMYKTVDIPSSLEFASGSNNIGLVLVATCIGIVAGSLGSSASVFTGIISNFNEIVMQLIIVVMWFSPIGIWSLLTVSFARMENISSTFASLGMLMFTVVFGMALQALVVYPGMYFFIVKKNPFVYMKGITQSLVTAFGTSSSAATLPVTLHCVENKNGVDKKISRFMLPIGVTINMDGSALYNAVTTIYLAQVYNYSLDFGKCLAISFAAVMASIGAAGVPTVTPVAILIVLQAAGIPVELISLVYAVDWLLDRFQTVLNVCGDCFGAGIVEHLSKNDLKVENKIEEEGHYEDVQYSKWI